MPRQVKWRATDGSNANLVGVGMLKLMSDISTDLKPELDATIEQLLLILAGKNRIKLFKVKDAKVSITKGETHGWTMGYRNPNNSTVEHEMVLADPDNQQSMPVILMTLEQVLRAIVENLSTAELLAATNDPKQLLKLLLALYPELQAKNDDTTKHVQLMLVHIIARNPQVDFVSVLNLQQAKKMYNVIGAMVHDKDTKNALQAKFASAFITVPTTAKHSKVRAKDSSPKNAFTSAPFTINYEVRKGAKGAEIGDSITLPEYPDKKFPIKKAENYSVDEAEIVYVDDKGKDHTLGKAEDGTWYELGFEVSDKLAKHYYLDENEQPHVRYVGVKGDEVLTVSEIKTDGESITVTFKGEGSIKKWGIELIGTFTVSPSGEVAIDTVPRNKVLLDEILSLHRDAVKTSKKLHM